MAGRVKSRRGRWSLMSAASGSRERPTIAYLAVSTAPFQGAPPGKREGKIILPKILGARSANVITMTGPTKILVASSLSRVSNWNNYKTSGGTTRVYSQTDRERQGRLG